MAHIKTNTFDEQIVFAGETDSRLPVKDRGAPLEYQWKILVVDDEDEVHRITRILLKDYRFEDKKIQILSAYSGEEARDILNREQDIALIFMDVVMEEDDTGLKLVDYVRKEMDNSIVRIVLRTGQPGKAPEQRVIFEYDINEYRTKPEFTAQKLFTSVTACLRAYKSLKSIQRNREGLESIINSSSGIFQHQSVASFGRQALGRLLDILKLNRDQKIDSACFTGMRGENLLLRAGTGIYSGKERAEPGRILPKDIWARCKDLLESGGEFFLSGAYAGVFTSKEGFACLLYIDTERPLSFTEKYLLRIYVNNIAIGFDNICLAQDIIKTQKEVILTLGEVVETRSKETANHVTRVAEFCYFLARRSGLGKEDADRLRLASPMHDVGKIGVPEAILNKPGKLTQEEFEVMKQHTQTGYDILCKSDRPIMKAASIIALQHHEQWNGKGYPRGLAREDIHIFGRIVAIADVFDALSHKRCYKEAWPLEKIVDLIQNSSGSHFDPDLAGLFIDNVDEFMKINKKFPE
ncbi:response regulator [Desulfospira joergensenii]|uniref:response regulator n=1 Tax=Desulfospira joergensenii TaxID=53329 RepID=UPI0003B5ED4A|nr:response regulator [Desulfospira joergensenii]